LLRWRLTSSGGPWRASFRILYSTQVGRSNAALNPACLLLTGWWSADFQALPWQGSASAGPSQHRNLVLDNDPGTGPVTSSAAISIFKVASFTNAATETAVNTTFFFVPSAWTLLVLMRPGWTEVLPVDPRNGTAIVSDRGAGNIGIMMADPGVAAFHYDGTSRPSVSVSTGGLNIWMFVQARYNGTHIQLRVNHGAWSQVAAANAVLGSVPLRVGANWDTSKKFAGLIAEIFTANTSLTNEQCDQVLSWVNGRYGLSL
jgi:hypothetical protein